MRSVMYRIKRWCHRKRAFPGSGIVSEKYPETGGTIACLVEQHGNPNAPLALTCQHVVAGGFFDRGKGDRIRERSSKARKIDHPSTIGTVDMLAGVALPPEPTILDCALIRLDDKSAVTACFPVEIGPLDPAPLASREITQGLPIQKFGAETRHTLGIITGFIDRVIESKDGQSRVWIRGLIEIESDPTSPEARNANGTTIDFCTGGDSGALIVTRSRLPRPVGLLISRDDGLMFRGRAIPMARICNQLNLTVCPT